MKSPPSRAGFNEDLLFETLLADLLVKFVNLPANRVDEEILDAQRRICDLLDLDAAVLWQRSAGEFITSHCYSTQEGRQLTGRLSQDDHPWFLEQLLANRTLAISSLEHMPPEAARDREACRHSGVKSNLSIPLSAGGGPPDAVFCLRAVRAERDWPEPLVQRLQLVAQIFANALARKYAEEALRESEANLKLAADSADAGLWSLGAGSDHFWVTEKTRSLFQFPPDQPITVDRFLAVIHPEDRERIRRTLAEALRDMREVRDEYRIVHPDDSVRWIRSRGRPRIGPSGELDRLAGISTDITERRTLREELESRLRFETLLAELSAGFVNLPPGDVDGAISDAQRRLCEVLGLERSSLWEPDPENPHDFRMTRIFDLDSGPTHKAMGASAGRFFPWILEQMRRGELVAIAKLDELPAEAAIDKESFRRLNTTASVIVPLLAGGVLFGTLTFAMIRREQAWPEGLLKRFRLVAQLFANALARKNAEQDLRHSLEEIEKLKLRLEQENIYLREEIEAERGIDEIVGQNPAMKDLLSQAEQVARTDSTVLILGETGTGKELLARAIHKMSARKDRPLITVSCAALAPTLIESELFGREKGAYTGALTKMIGRFEIADGSTLFLDEVGEIPLELQSKLLRVLEEGSFERLGSTKTLHVNVRVIAATNRDLEQEAKDGRFRKDLFYRLNVFPMTIPPLRERPRDIPFLVWAFVREFQKRMGKEIEAISKKSMDALQSYSWPGNVRELRNVVEHAMILNQSENLVIHAPGVGSPEAGAPPNLRKMERDHIIRVLDQAGWRIAGPGGAAEALGLTRSTLYSKMKKLQIHRPS